MEKLIILNLMVFLIAGMSTLATAAEPEGFGTGLEQSPHNFSHASWLPRAQVCHVCHTVHNADIPAKRYSDGLLWKSNVNSVSYALYHSYWGADFYDTRDKTSWTSTSLQQ